MHTIAAISMASVVGLVITYLLGNLQGHEAGFREADEARAAEWREGSD